MKINASSFIFIEFYFSYLRAYDHSAPNVYTNEAFQDDVTLINNSTSSVHKNKVVKNEGILIDFSTPSVHKNKEVKKEGILIDLSTPDINTNQPYKTKNVYSDFSTPDINTNQPFKYEDIFGDFSTPDKKSNQPFKYEDIFGDFTLQNNPNKVENTTPQSTQPKPDSAILPQIKNYDFQKLIKIDNFLAYLTQNIHMFVRNSTETVESCKEKFKTQKVVLVIDKDEIMGWETSRNSFLSTIKVFNSNLLGEYEKITKNHEMIFYIMYTLHILMHAEIKLIDLYFTHNIFIDSHNRKNHFLINLQDKEDIFKFYKYLLETRADKIDLTKTLKIEDNNCIFFIDKNFYIIPSCSQAESLKQFKDFINESFKGSSIVQKIKKSNKNKPNIFNFFRRLFKHKSKKSTPLKFTDKNNRISFVCCTADHNYSDVLRRDLANIKNGAFINSLTDLLNYKRKDRPISIEEILFKEIPDYIREILVGKKE